MRGLILIVDDEKTLSFFLKQNLEEEGYEVLLARTGREGLDTLEQNQVDLALLDLMLPDMEGSQVLREIRSVDAYLPVIILTGHGTINSAVEAMRLGAYDYVEKPLDLSALKLSIARALESLALRREIERLRAQGLAGYPWIVGGSRKMREIASLVERVAKSKATVLIEGESGTGKEVIAQAIHRGSERGEQPFVALNCAAIPENLLETELFGHEAGAFTDAKRQKKGLIEMADGGTLFLDEIGAMRPDMQAKLLRVLESETLRRVGATRDIKVDLRFIAATNRDLKQAIAAGEFREDLFYRLSVVVIDVPPLRERPEDIDQFLATFLADFAGTMGKSVQGISEEARSLLQAYTWPGNVRELRNVLERAVILCDGSEILPSHLPAEIVDAESRVVPRRGLAAEILSRPESGLKEGINLREILAKLERRMIEEALKQAGGNQSEAARLLGISRDMLRYSMQKYGVNAGG